MRQRILAVAMVAAMLVLTACDGQTTGSNSNGSGGSSGGLTTVKGTLTCRDGSIPFVYFSDSVEVGRTKVHPVTAGQKGGGFMLKVESGTDQFRATLKGCGASGKRSYDFPLSATNIVCSATTCSGSHTTAGYDRVSGTIACTTGGTPARFGVDKTTRRNEVKNISYNRGRFSFEVKNADLGYIPKFTGCGSGSWTKASQSWKDRRIALVCSAATACRKAGPQTVEQAGRIWCLVKKKKQGHPNSVAAADFKTKQNVTSAYSSDTGRYTVTMKNPRDGYKLWISGCGGQATKGPLYTGYFVITCGTRPDGRIGGHSFRSFRC